jgi:hypothetical protein
MIYKKSFANEFDHKQRFMKALEASARPIRDYKALQKWYCLYGCKERPASIE